MENRILLNKNHYIIDAGIQPPWGTQGQAIYEGLNDNPNMFLMLCGHKSAEGIRQDTTINGNIVYTLLSDYQYYPNGGNGFLRIMEFSPMNNTIQVKTYSPSLNQYETKGSSQCTLIYDMPIWLSPDTLKLLANDISNTVKYESKREIKKSEPIYIPDVVQNLKTEEAILNLIIELFK